MKKFEIVGEVYVLSSDAQAEIDALKTQKLELKAKHEKCSEYQAKWRDKYLTLATSLLSILGLDEFTSRDEIISAAEQLKAQRDELLAAQQWRPIESAPKTGFFKAWHGLWACEITVQRLDDASWVIEKTKTTRWPIEAFSRWMPLPPAPETIK